MINFAPCRKELNDFPEAVREYLADALAKLDAGVMLSMPVSRPMPSIGSRIHELRFRNRSGVYRVVYFLALGGVIHLLCAFKKTTQKTDQKHLDLAKKRLREVI